jgi:hypothetical protein
LRLDIAEQKPPNFSALTNDELAMMDRLVDRLLDQEAAAGALTGSGGPGGAGRADRLLLKDGEIQ